MTDEVATNGNETTQHKPDKHEPHVFQEISLQPVFPPIAPGVGGTMWVSPGTPVDETRVCAVCLKPRTHRLHLEGEAGADAESPNWG